ncbi:3600_t:CDS:2 [Entrophospora sp. SA101]|nr:3600_t:CDS:2 [Entrophospora sp. SA101]
MPDDVPSSKRQRVSKACDSCRRKKVKCDGIQSVCGNCKAFNLECTYNDTTKKRGPPKGYIEAIETRLHKMESLLGGLVHSNDPRAEAALAELMQDDLHSTSSNRSNNSGDLIDDLNEVMGILSIDENNQIRYHGRSSGFYLLKKGNRYKDGILSITSNNWKHPGQVIASTNNFDLLKRPELTELPSQELSDHLLELYFNNVHPLMAVIYKPRFFDQLKQKEHPPLLLLNAIYAYASQFSDRIEVRSDPNNHHTAGDFFFERAKALLDNDYDNARMTTIQALILLSLREYGTGRVTRAWLYSGMACRMSQELGIHRNNEKWHPIDLKREEKEEQRRVFWACFVLDRTASAHLGRPLAIDEKDVDAAYPSEDEDDESEYLPFKMEHVTVSSTSSPVSSSSSALGSPIINGPQEPRIKAHTASRFIYLIKLCEILGRVMQNVYAIRCNPVSMTSDTVLSILNSSLNSWYLALPEHLQYTPNSDQAKHPSTLCLHILYYSALMFLHRPYASLHNSSHEVCTKAATAITEIAVDLLNNNQLNQAVNAIVYCIFTAGVIHTYNATQDDSNISRFSKIQLAHSLKLLEEFKKRWQTAFKYYELLLDLVDLKEIQLDPELTRGNSSSENQQKPVGFTDRAWQSRYRTLYNQSNLSNETESAQMFNNPFSFKYITSNTTNPRDQKPIGVTDPYGAPGMVSSSTNNTVATTTPNDFQASLNTNTSTPNLWGLPHNADLNEWSSYFGSQESQHGSGVTYTPTLPSQQTPLQIQQQGGGRGRISNLPLQPQRQILLHNDGSDVNMYANTQPLISNAMGANNINNHRGGRDNNSNGLGGGGRGRGGTINNNNHGGGNGVGSSSNNNS